MLWSSGRTLTNFSRCRLCLCILCQFNSRPVWVRVLLDFTWSFLVPQTIPVAFEFVVFDCVLRFAAVPVSGPHSKCAGLTRSTETVSTLLFIRIFMTLPFLTMTLYGPSKWRSDATLLRFFAKIHVSMFRVPYIGKCFSDVCRAVGTNGDATWLPVAYQSSCLNLYVRRRCPSV